MSRDLTWFQYPSRIPEFQPNTDRNNNSVAFSEMKTSLASLEEILGFSNRPISEGDIPEAIQELENTQEAWKVVETPGPSISVAQITNLLDCVG